jgi:uncharacterized membrane-anchored protein
VLGALAWLLNQRRAAPELTHRTTHGVGLGARSTPAGDDARAHGAAPSSERAARDPPLARIGIVVGTLAALVVCIAAIWQKEQLVAHGRPIYVELAPVDPRSLMQGDFMQLAFRVPAAVDPRIAGLVSSRRPFVVARVDARGIATLQRVDDGGPLQAGELRIELTPKNGRWTFVTDAWYFREGDAERWSNARYGEFRVGDDGRALLVGMADAQLLPIKP